MENNTIFDSPGEKKILTEYRKLIKASNEVDIAVAYITSLGWFELTNGIDMSKKKVRVITTTDQNITDKSAIDLMVKSGAEIKVSQEDSCGGFHAKLIIFKGDKTNIAYSGSTNFTKKAFYKNVETTSTNNFEEAKQYFERLWNLKCLLKSNEIELETIPYNDDYIEYHDEGKKMYLPDFEYNSMQANALKELENLKLQGSRKYLLWSATATGKTVTSIGAIGELESKKTLFVVDQNFILISAMSDYEKFAPHLKIGLYENGMDYSGLDVLFITDVSASKLMNSGVNLHKEFDLLILDEAHHAGAGTDYLKLFDEFYNNGKMVFGMTATPFRTSDPKSIVILFGEENFIGRITPTMALKNDLIVKSKYISINIKDAELTSDYTIKEVYKKLRKLESTYEGKMKALIFVPNITKSSDPITEKLSELGLNVVAVNSKNKANFKDVVDRLQNEDDKLEAIVAVNMFNEGVDIPRVNNIVMLRETDSKIVFTQQLGRALRKSQGKKFAYVIDVARNYSKNFEHYSSAFGLEEKNDTKSILKIFEKLRLNDGESPKEVKVKTESGNEFTFMKISEDEIFENISSFKGNLKYIDSYREKVLSNSIEKRDLNFSKIESILDEKIQVISNSYRNSSIKRKILSYHLTDDNYPWIVELHKDYLITKGREDILKGLSKNEKVLIELLSWMPLTVSTKSEKLDVLSLISGKEVKMSNKWQAYFTGEYVGTGSKVIKVPHIIPEYSELLKGIVKNNDGKISLKIKKSKSLTYFIDIIVDYLYTNLRDDKFRVNTWYSNLEMSFQMGMLSIPQTGDIKTMSKELENEDLKYAIKASVKKESKKKNYNNQILNKDNVMFLRRKNAGEYSKNDEVHLFLSANDGKLVKKFFTNDAMSFYVGSAMIKDGKLKYIGKSQENAASYEMQLSESIDFVSEFILKY